MPEAQVRCDSDASGMKGSRSRAANRGILVTIGRQTSGDGAEVFDLLRNVLSHSSNRTPLAEAVALAICLNAQA
jgi:hypothetical protein